jgi:plasmid stabilization system protein ParE
MSPAIFLPEAVEEVDEAIRYYEVRSPGLGTQFFMEIETAAKEIEQDPVIWPIYTKNTRRRLLKRFPFAIIYQIEAEEIIIVAVAHSSRKPGYWMDRV